MAVNNLSSLLEFSKKLKDRAQDIKKRVESMRGASVVVGIPSNARYPNGKRVAEVAERIEYGVMENGAPMRAGPRPFMRVTVDNNKDKWNRMLQDGVRESWKVSGTPDVRSVMMKVGEQMQQDIQRTMEEMGLSETGKMHDSVKVLKINNEVLES